MDSVPEHRASPLPLGDSDQPFPLLVRRGSEALQKNRSYVIQSAFIWCQFYEIQLHIHRMFALRDPPDPQLTTPSMIICKSAAKQCIGIIESAKDVLVTPLCTHILTVSSGSSQKPRYLTTFTMESRNPCSPPLYSFSWSSGGRGVLTTIHRSTVPSKLPRNWCSWRRRGDPIRSHVK